jgi:cellulose synthase/poly-beta-1,6-N-acetylglucosamine synthase-like glycosyltransferase
MNLQEALVLYNDVFIYYTLFVVVVYLSLALLSRKAYRTFKDANIYTDYAYLSKSEYAPMVSVIAPAYNESVTIVENVKSLISLKYNHLEIIVVNDGSKDDTMEKLIREFDLKLDDMKPLGKLESNRIKGVYTSKKFSLRKLIVIDKENGGKADALNAGINYSRSGLVACIDVDCILQPDSLVKMVKPFVLSNKTIAVGGVVRVLNDSIVDGGNIVKVRQSRNFWVRFQILEYVRAFMLGRMAWSKLNGLILISGAFGLFRRDVLIACGGYDTNTVGEDMELIVRMRRYMHEKKMPYKVKYIPEPLCWTEVPSNLSILKKQRSRWTRGTIETLLKHKDVFFKRKYGIMGMISFPFWLLFEWFAPLLEFVGIVSLIVLSFLGLVDWNQTFLMLGLVYSFAVFFSALTLLAEEKSYFNYTNRNDIFRILITALLEPIVFHPLIVYYAILGNIDMLRGKKSWGDMKRTGFNPAAIGTNIELIPSE